MSVKIYFHYDLSILARQLAEDIGKEVQTKGRSVFKPVNISIPVNHFRTWLPLQLAAGSPEQVSANLKFEYMESSLWGMLTALAPGEHQGAKLLNKNTLALQVLGVLQAITPGNAGVLAPFSNYLYESNKQSGSEVKLPDYDRRIWQVAMQLAGLFQDYEYHRQAMIKNWVNGKLSLKGDAMEACQAELYRRAIKAGANSGTYTLSQLSELVSQKKCEGVKGPVYFFGFSELSKFHIDLIWQLGQYYDINFYQFNVCREYWEDITTNKEDRGKFLARIKKNMDISSGADEEKLILRDDTGKGIDDNPLLKAWGKPGRELIKGYSEAEEKFQGKVYTIAEHPDVDNWKGGRSTTLMRVQGQVLDRLVPGQSEGDTDIIPQDDTIQIVSCSDIYREVESVYNSIIWNMGRDNKLKSTDITVLVSDMAKYKPVIQSVFSRRGVVVPFNLSDSTAERDSVYAQGVRAILGLAGGAYSRSALFSVFYNPCFMQAAGVTRAEVDIWSNWARALNIFRWADAGHKKEDTADGFTEGLYTWEWGLKRLRLGRIMGSGEGNPDIPPVYADMDSKNSALLSAFSGMAERLTRRIRGFSQMGSMTPAKWAQEFRGIFEAFLAIPRDRVEEAAVRNSLMVTLDALQKDSTQLCAQSSGQSIKLTSGVASEIVLAGLSDIPSRIGKYGVGGVTVASLKNARPVPFQIVYMLGLEENSFPANSVRSTLDLRTRKVQIGDITPRDHDLFRFLEAFMSARQKLYLTYIGQDLQKDEIFQPSSAVKQILYCLDPILSESPGFPGAVDFDVKYRGFNMPLHGFSRRYLENVPGYFDLMVNYSNQDKELYGISVSYTDEQDANQGLAKSKIKSQEDDKNASVTTSTGLVKEQNELQKKPVKINLYDLRSFLLNPAEGQMRYRLGISEDTTDDTAEIEDERFFSVFPADYKLLTGTLDKCLEILSNNESPNVRQECQKLAKISHDAGDGADFAFLEADTAEIINKAEIFWQTLQPNLQKLKESYVYNKTLSIGQSWRDESHSLSSVVINLDGQLVEITGDLKNVWTDEKYNIVECLAWKMSGPKSNEIHLNTFLFQTALGAAEGGDPGISKTLFINGDKPASWKYTWESSKKRDEWFKTLLRDFLFRKSFDWVPWSIVGSLKDEDFEVDGVTFNNMLNTKIQEKLADNYNVFTRLNQLYLTDVIVPDDALELCRQRLSPLRNFIHQKEK